jgi:hypothetical protein
MCARRRHTVHVGGGVASSHRSTLAAASQSITIRSQSEAGAAGAPSNKQENWSWKYHHVLHNAGQDTVYDTLCRDIVESAVGGTNATIMAYGQVGATPGACV